MNSAKRHRWLLWVGGLLLIVVVLSQAFRWLVHRPTTSPPPQVMPPPKTPPLYDQALFLGEGSEWRAYPLLVDMNGDGHLDLVATFRINRERDANALHIWLGTGQGSFNEMPPTWPSPTYSGLAAGDINHDGHLDLLAASHSHNIFTFLSDGEGQFTVSTLGSQDGYVAARLVDVNGDGYLDAIVLGEEEVGIEIYLGDGTGKWTLTTQLMQGKIGRDLAIGDIDGDGKPDIVAAFADGVAVFLQDETGGWVSSPPEAYAIPGMFESVALGDVNQDGHLDIVLNGEKPLGNSRLYGPDVYLGDGKGGWTAASNGLKVLPYTTPGIALGDVNNDGCLDIVAGGNTTGSINNKAMGLFLFTGDCQGHWALQPNSGLPSVGLVPPYGIALGDLNDDGLLDIVVVHGSWRGRGGYLSVWIHQ